MSKPAAASVDPAAIPQRRLFTGATMPAIGLGTFGSDHVSPAEVAEAVEGAAAVGYRHFDCASVYGNEAEIGASFEAILQNGIPAQRPLDHLQAVERQARRRPGHCLLPQDPLPICASTTSTSTSSIGRFPTFIRPAAMSLRAALTPSPTFTRTT